MTLILEEVAMPERDQEKWVVFGGKEERILEVTADGDMVLIAHVGHYLVGVVKHKKGDWRETEKGIEIRVGAAASYLLSTPDQVPEEGSSGSV